MASTVAVSVVQSWLDYASSTVYISESTDYSVLRIPMLVASCQVKLIFICSYASPSLAVSLRGTFITILP